MIDFTEPVALAVTITLELELEYEIGINEASERVEYRFGSFCCT